MAETFKNQVDALTGFASTEDDALSDWLTSGARLVLDIMSPTKLMRVGSNTNFTDSTDIEGKKITVDDESKIMDPDTYSTVSSAPDKNIKKWLKHKGFKE